MAKLSFRTNVRNLKPLFFLDQRFLPAVEMTEKTNCDTVSFAGEGWYEGAISNPRS